MLNKQDWDLVGSALNKQDQHESISFLFVSQKRMKGMIVSVGKGDSWVTVKFEGPSLTLERYLRYHPNAEAVPDNWTAKGALGGLLSDDAFHTAGRWLSNLMEGRTETGAVGTRDALVNMNGLFLMEGGKVAFALGWNALPPVHWPGRIDEWIKGTWRPT